MAYPYPFPFPGATPTQEPLQAAAAAAAGRPFPMAYTNGYTPSSYATAPIRGPPTAAYSGFFPVASGGGGAPYSAAPFPVAGSGPGPGSVTGTAATGVMTPGSTAYFTTPHQGGFYTDPYAEQMRQQQMHQTMQQHQAQEDGRLYNGWAGLPDDENNKNEDEDANENDKKDKKNKSRAKSDKKKDKKDKRSERHAASKNGHGGPDKTPADAFPVLSQTEPAHYDKKQHHCRLRRRAHDRCACDSEDEDDTDNLSSFYGSDSDSDSRSRAHRTRPPPVCDVPLHLGGSGRIVVHYVGGAQPDTDADDRHRRRARSCRRRHRHRCHRKHDGAESDTDPDTNTALSSSSSSPSPPPAPLTAAEEDTPAVPAITSFAVSARRMRQTAKNWTWLCRPGADACETTVDDPAAVLGMYRMLEVLHMGVPPGQAAAAAAAAERSMKEHCASFSSSSASPPSLFPRDPSRPLPPTPVVLPPRVLAYVILFGLEFGALQLAPGTGTASMADDAKSQQQRQNTASSLLLAPAPPSVSTSAPHQPPPLPNLLRARATAWLDAFAYSVGSSSENHSIPAAENAALPPRSDRPSPLAHDWPYVLYVARMLGHRALFGACLRLLLEQWGPLVETGEAGALLAALPPAMQTPVQRDIGCLRAARMRSVESIINAAMHTFSPPSL